MNRHAPSSLGNELMHSFPEYADLIPALIHLDEGFREIAEDWLLCKQELNNLEKPSISISLVTDYTETLKALEIELITCMAAKRNSHNA